MKLTKFEHACFTVELDGKLLVVDPGVLSPDFTVSDNIVAVIVTHEHPDHFDPETLAKIYDKNPDSLLISTQAVIDKMINHTSQVAIPGESLTVGPFNLSFFGGAHAEIYKTVPVVDNVAVLINESLYYPGDSFTTPSLPVATLAVPLGAPWLKTSETIDFMLAVKPDIAFPTHDAVLSKDGQTFNDSWMQRFAEPAGIAYTRIDGQTVDL
jgi:L-ascorbate metabolism protein UlaG (beta-lactamase superfamily)